MYELVSINKFAKYYYSICLIAYRPTNLNIHNSTTPLFSFNILCGRRDTQFNYTVAVTSL